MRKEEQKNDQFLDFFWVDGSCSVLLRLECFVAHGKAELKVTAELDPLERGQNLGILVLFASVFLSCVWSF